MEFLRKTILFLIVLICAVLLIGTLWYCLVYRGKPGDPEGTLVYDRMVSCQEVAA